jgi:hypothetical protein
MAHDDEFVVAQAALGLRSTAQFLGRLGAEAGVFARLGVDFQIAAFETTAPVGLAGLVEGKWAFGEMGAVPVVDGLLAGSDPVILLAPEQINAMFVISRSDVGEPAALAGGRIGVLSETGQTIFTARAMLARWGLTDEVAPVALGTYPRIYEAIAGGEVEAGVLTADYRFAGAAAHGMNALVNLGDEFGFQGPIIATTRRVIATEAELVGLVVRGYVEAIHLFKTDRATVLPLLRNHLGFDDATAVEATYDFYVPRFQSLPLPSMDGIARVIEQFRDRYPAAAEMTPDDVCDRSFLGAFETDGLIDRLYRRDYRLCCDYIRQTARAFSIHMESLQPALPPGHPQDTGVGSPGGGAGRPRLVGKCSRTVQPKQRVLELEDRRIE